MNHDQDCPCATDNVPHGAGCADCSCVKNICPTCEGDVKGEIVDGKCRACQLGVIPDWMKPKDTEKRKSLCGVFVREMGPCVAELHSCKAHPRCGAIPDGGGEPCHKTPAHGGVCENDTHVWDWKPKLRGE